MKPTQALGPKPKVCVFSPAPLLTITVESVRDESAVHVHAGGQGPWVANMLAVLGTEVLLCAPLGGETGSVLRALLDRDAFRLHVVQTAGSNGCYVQDRRGGDRVDLASMNPGVLSRHEADDLYGASLAAGLEAGIAVLSGPARVSTVPVDLYARLAADLSTLGVSVVADLSGEPLAAALDGGAAVVKVSHEELVADGRAASDKVPDLVDAMHSMAKQVSSMVVVSRAQDPAFALVNGHAFEIVVPSLRHVEHRGAGDAMTAGLAAGLAHKSDPAVALRLGAAAGTANVTRHGLASGQWQTVEAIAERVIVRPLTEDKV